MRPECPNCGKKSMVVTHLSAPDDVIKSMCYEDYSGQQGCGILLEASLSESKEWVKNTGLSPDEVEDWIASLDRLPEGASTLERLGEEFLEGFGITPEQIEFTPPEVWPSPFPAHWEGDPLGIEGSMGASPHPEVGEDSEESFSTALGAAYSAFDPALAAAEEAGLVGPSDELFLGNLMPYLEETEANIGEYGADLAALTTYDDEGEAHIKADVDTATYMRALMDLHHYTGAQEWILSILTDNRPELRARLQAEQDHLNEHLLRRDGFVRALERRLDPPTS